MEFPGPSDVWLDMGHHFHAGGCEGSSIKVKVPLDLGVRGKMGLMQEEQRKFSVMMAWGSSLPQSCILIFGSHPHRIATKWFFQVRMARSVAFL